MRTYVLVGHHPDPLPLITAHGLNPDDVVIVRPDNKTALTRATEGDTILDLGEIVLALIDKGVLP